MDKEQPFSSHLKELRNRLLIVMVIVIGSFCGILPFSNQIIKFLISEGIKARFQMVYISPAEVVIQQLKTAFISSMCIALPIVFYEIIAFISPAFERKKDIRNLSLLVFVGFIMFAIGVVFTWKLLLPFSLTYFNSAGLNLGINSQISISYYLGFVISLTVAIGLSFELPIVCFILTALRIINYDRIKKVRPVAIILIFILAAIITPPDVMTQLIVAIPLCVLFEISIVVIRLTQRKRKK